MSVSAVSAKSKSAVKDSTKLTDPEKRIVKEIWLTRIKKDLKYHGCQIFIKLFTKYPDYLNYFNFSQQGVETELMENKIFQAHCVAVMAAINTLIEFCFDDHELYKSMLAKMARSHFRRKITSVPIENLCEIIFEYVLTNCKKDPKPEVQEAWRRFMASIVEVFIEELSI